MTVENSGRMYARAKARTLAKERLAVLASRPTNAEKPRRPLSGASTAARRDSHKLRIWNIGRHWAPGPEFSPGGSADFQSAIGDQCGFLAHDFLLRIVKPHNGASMRVRQSGLVRASTGFEWNRNARPFARLQRNGLCRSGGNLLTIFACQTALEPHKSRPVAALRRKTN